MRKIIKKIGKAIVIQFSKEEQQVFRIKKDHIFDIELVEVKK